MEVDITKKVNYVLKYGFPCLLLLACLCAAGVWQYQQQRNSLVVNDAKIMSLQVGAKAKTSGTVEEMMVSDGDYVEAGDVIARIKVDVTEEQIQHLEQAVEMSKQNLEQLKKGTTVTRTIPGEVISVPAIPSRNGASRAEVGKAEARMKRMDELFEMGAISAVQRDQARAEYNAAVASAAAASAPPAVSRTAPPRVETVVQPTDPEIIKRAEFQLHQAEAALSTAKEDAQGTDVLAPVAGIVYSTDVKEGSEVKPGQAIVNISDAADIWLEARVARKQKDKLRLGQFVSYTVEGKKLQGTVLDIIDPAEDTGDAASPEKPGNNAQENGAAPAAESAESGASAADAAAQAPSGTGAQQPAGTEEPPSPVDKKRLLVRISVPMDAGGSLRPGQAAIVKFSL